MTIVRFRWLPFSVLIAGILSAGSPGVRPRASVADYPAHQAAAVFTVGAAVIPRSDVKKIFAADLNSAGYIVVEAGVFPSPGQAVDLSPADFTLRTDTARVSTRPVDSEAVAAVIARQRRSSPRVYAGTAAGVRGSVGTPRVNDPVPFSAPSLSAMEQELWSKSLPDGMTSVAVAGYLYFPKPAGKTNGAWELTMDGAAGRVKLPLQNPH